MADPCIIRSGEVVALDDPRLSDTGCVIETGVIIRPALDETTVKKVAPAKSKKTTQEIKKEVQTVVEEPAADIDSDSAVVEKESTTTIAQETVDTTTSVEKSPDFEMTPIAALAVAGAIAVVGASTTAAGGVGAIQTKLAALFGSKTAATVAGGATVAAGMIVAVKALENKVDNLETDLKKTKDDVNSASSTIDRIDDLLSRLETLE